MGSHPVIPHPFPSLLSSPSLQRPLSLLSPGLSTEGKACALGGGPVVCGQGCLASHSSGPVFPSQGLERVKVYGERWGWTPGF